MGVQNLGLKAVALASVLFLAVACETPVQESANTGGQGGAQAQGSASQGAVQGEKMKGQVKPGSQEDLVLNVGDRVFFDFDKSELKPEARKTVERWASWLKQYPEVTVTIEGHADERGTREYNLGLGERRASAATNYLVALGVNPDRLGTISYGKERPVCVASTESCWAQNRRAVMVVN
ncbi:MAG TPA: peptidoglycan-associated lipoprotein Pal [Alphaproteobacteria bacterium]|jgi:peptidoglycan-associated lipoprotein|nr:peptidoglycan-associated lipoprotein Pal [Alphaproteobacteria bacterium]